MFTWNVQQQQRQQLQYKTIVNACNKRVALDACYYIILIFSYVKTYFKKHNNFQNKARGLYNFRDKVG